MSTTTSLAATGQSIEIHQGARDREAYEGAPGARAG
jgi:hypothetical protein